MAKRDRAAFEKVHAPGEDARNLAALILQDGMWECVDGHTPVDEVIEGEMDMGITEPIEAGVVIVPLEDYDLMKLCAVKARLPMSWDEHQAARPGWVVMPAEDLVRRIREAKVHTFLALMRYVWQNSGSLWAAMRNLLAITHKHSPQFISGMSGAEIGKFLGVGRAAFNKHSIKIVVDYLERWGVKGGTAGGSKPHGHREKKRKQMLGRRHRSAHYVSDTEPEEPKITAADRLRIKALRDQAERERVAKLCGLQPQDIDLDKTRPAEAA